MNVVLCRSCFRGPIDGAGETLATYAAELSKAGHNPSVLLMYSHPTEDQYTDRLKRLDVKVSHVTDHPVHSMLMLMRRAAGHFFRVVPRSPHSLHEDAERISHRVAQSYFKRCRELLARSRADVVHVLTSDAATPVMIAAAHAAGLPVIYHELGTPCHPHAYAPYHQRLIRTLPLCNGIAALSPQLAECCREKYPVSDKVTVLPLMVEDLYTERAPENSSHEVTFGFAARIEALKGPLVLAEAFARLHGELPNVRLKMAGMGSEETKVVTLLQEYDVEDCCDLSGTYTTFKQKRSFMQSLDVLVHPSWSEGTPNTIIEAMSNGLPVIASAVGGIPDLVSEESGILVAPGDVPALINAMHRLAVNPQLRHRMGRAARRRYEQIFSPDRVLPLLLEAYRRVAETEQAYKTAVEIWEDAHPWSGEVAVC
jgi:glycosyltransferase involved in cell wall biosynthesis